MPAASVHDQFIACPAGKKALGFSLIDVFTIEVLKADLTGAPAGVYLSVGATCATAA